MLVRWRRCTNVSAVGELRLGGFFRRAGTELPRKVVVDVDVNNVEDDVSDR